MNTKKEEGFQSAQELAGDYVVGKTNSALEQAHFWMDEYLRLMEKDGIQVKTVIIHFEGDSINVDDTDLVNVKVQGSPKHYVESLFEKGFHLFSAYPSDVDRTGNNFNLVLRFLKGKK